MKKLLILFLSLAMLSCSDDDGGPAPNPNFDLVIGTWNLSELTISPAQDINDDGTTTTNILDELPCISARISLGSDNTWSYSGNDVVITTITGGLFKFFCSDQTRTAGGNWDIQGNLVRLADASGNVTQFTFDSTDNTLTNVIGENLPGLQAEIYSK
jgi:YD repeat-containing protein